jgi:hypothetical protein
MWTILGSSGVAIGALDLSGQIGWLMAAIVLILTISSCAIALASIDARSERSPLRAEVTRRNGYRRAP